MYYVIGSGPSGVATAAALIAAGRRVTLLDGGLTLAPERASRRARMAGCDPDEWAEEDVRASRTPVNSEGEIEAKLCYGSAHPYQPMPSEIEIDYGELHVRGSFAKGGLSEVWGASVLPFRSQDIQDWPVDPDELAEAQAAVSKILPIAARRDDVARLFPMPPTHLREGRESQQIQRLMANLERHRAQLSRRGVVFGGSRLAVNFSGETPCNYCGHCMHGCPRDLIYSSRHTLTALIASGSLKYIPSTVVDRIAEDGDQVAISATTPAGRVQYTAERVFLATGVFNSTAILARSMGWYGRELRISDVQYYLLPLLQFRASPDVASERLHTLAQAFLEISNDSLSPHLVHLQIYGFNDLLKEMLECKLGRLRRYFPKNAILGRLLLVQGYLHSSHSGYIRGVLTKHGTMSRLQLKPVTNPATAKRAARVASYLRRLSPALGALPMAPLLQVTQPGRGFHCGGSFPMAKHPGERQTDALGRPSGWNRVHVVDATIFPSIPATTITQTVMANAFRIGSTVARLDRRDSNGH